MKTAGLHLLGLIATMSLAAEEIPPPTSPKTSDRLKTEIRASLPRYLAPVPKDINELGRLSLESDPDLFALPKLTVREKRPPRIEANDLLTPRALNKKFALEYDRSLTGLDRVLNGFTIPLFSPSFGARGRAAFQARQFSDIRHVIEIGRLADPQNTTLASEKVDLREALDRQNRPAGEGRAK